MVRRSGRVRLLGAMVALGLLGAAAPARAADPVRVYNCMEASEAMNQR